MVWLGFLSLQIISNQLMPRRDKREKDRWRVSLEPMVESHQTGTFEGRSTNWTIAPQPDKDLKNMYQSVA